MALPPGKTIKEVYGRDVDVNAPFKVSPQLKAQADAVDKGQSLSSVGTRASEREPKPNPKYKGGKSRRRHSKKTKRTRRHNRKH